MACNLLVSLRGLHLVGFTLKTLTWNFQVDRIVTAEVAETTTKLVDQARAH